MNANAIDAWVPCQEAADIAGVHYNTMRALARSGKIRFRRTGLGPRSPILIPRAEIRRVKQAYGYRKSAK